MTQVICNIALFKVQQAGVFFFNVGGFMRLKHDVADLEAFPVKWRPVDETKLLLPPQPWPSLKGKLPEGYYERVSRFWTTVVEDGNERYIQGPLAVLGESFGRSFQFEGKQIGLIEHETFSGVAWIVACHHLSREFGNVIPPLLWEVIASLGTRRDPLVEVAIPTIQDELPYPWGVCDAALHATGKAYGLLLHIEERLREKTGHILLHGCGCNHVVREVATLAGECRFPTLDQFRRRKAGLEFLDHFLSELDLVFVRGYPFRMNPETLRSVRIISG